MSLGEQLGRYQRDCSGIANQQVKVIKYQQFPVYGKLSKDATLNFNGQKCTTDHPSIVDITVLQMNNYIHTTNKMLIDIDSCL